MSLDKAAEAKSSAGAGSKEDGGDVESYLTRIGTWNHFPLRFYFLVISAEIVVAMQWLASSFVNLEPGHRCRIPSIDDTKETPTSEQISSWIPKITDKKTGELVLDKCKEFVDANSNDTQDCSNGWVYEYEGGETAVMQWDLVCDRAELNARMTSVFFSGVLLGCLLIPTLSDYFGRKKIMLVCFFLSLPFGVGAAFSDSWITLAALKFFVAFFLAGGTMCMYILVCEFFPSSHRSFAGNCIWFAWVIGYMMLPALAYWLKTWWHLQLVITLPLLPLLIAYIPFVPESIHFLLNNEQSSLAEEILQKGAKLNGIQDLEIKLIPDQPVNNVNSDGKQKKATLFHVLITRYFNIMALLMGFVWTVNAMVYYGLSLNTSSLGGDIYINFFISGVVEIPAYAACIILMKYVDRRKPCCGFHIIAGVPLFILLFIPFKTSDGVDLTDLRTALTMIGKFGITASFGAIYLQATELYPTSVRNAGLGFSSTLARIGTLIAPYINLLAKDSNVVEPVVFGVLALVAAVIVMSFPETKGRLLPTTLDDVRKPWFTYFGFRETGSIDSGQMKDVGHVNPVVSEDDGTSEKNDGNVSYITAC